MEKSMNRTDTVILVTGAAGFIGYHVARRLLERGDQVLGVDNLSDYYDVRLKEARLAQLESSRGSASSNWRSLTAQPCGICSPPIPLGGSCTWRPRQACGIHWSTPMPMRTATSWDF